MGRAGKRPVKVIFDTDMDSDVDDADAPARLHALMTNGEEALAEEIGNLMIQKPSGIKK
jgi:hypothetical protein